VKNLHARYATAGPTCDSEPLLKLVVAALAPE
jgi:hypothetical protein